MVSDGDPRLIALVEVWSDLPETIKGAIIKLSQVE